MTQPITNEFATANELPVSDRYQRGLDMSKVPSELFRYLGVAPDDITIKGWATVVDTEDSKVTLYLTTDKGLYFISNKKFIKSFVELVDKLFLDSYHIRLLHVGSRFGEYLTFSPIL